MSTSRQASSQRRCPPEMRERAVRMVREAIDEAGGVRGGVIPRVARQPGVGVESLRHWGEPSRDRQGASPEELSCRIVQGTKID
jgi:transposase